MFFLIITGAVIALMLVVVWWFLLSGAGKECCNMMEHQHHIPLLTFKLFFSWTCALLLMLGMFNVLPLFHNKWIMFLLATPVQFWVGAMFYQVGWMEFKNRSAGMFTLIILGTTIAYFYSVMVMLLPFIFKHAGIPLNYYFESGVMIIAFILLGTFLEERAKGQTSQALKKLLGLQAKNATIFRDGAWVEVPIDQVKMGDRILVKPGEKVPTDGIILSGEAIINESMVTGESKPVHKKKGDKVIGSTINDTGSFEIEAIKVGKETFLSQIIDMVQQAQSSRASVQQLVDKVSGYFVPIVIILALTTFLLWLNFGPQPYIVRAIVSMVAVFIVACPCALGLATPTSIMVGIGKGAQSGILIKDAQVLETGAKISVVIFDKTGTLTEEKRSVNQIRIVTNVNDIAQQQNWPGNLNTEQWLKLALSSIEHQSTHPVSQAIYTYLKDGETPELQVENLKSVLGLGVTAVVEGQMVAIGSERFMEDQKVTIDQDLQNGIKEFSQKGNTVSLAAVNGVAVVLFSIADRLRDGASSVIKQLKQMGIESAIISGDNETIVKNIAQELGIQHVLAQVLPQDKQAYVKQIQKEGKRVAMVGDGINDAPALAAADVGIAMGSGTDVAIESAGVTLLRSDISLVPQVMRLSRLTMRNIKQNLLWAFGYNILLIPIAMGLLYYPFGILITPIYAGAAMAFSSLSVVLNALRLRYIKI
jgi:heavy metal translocating P-type ATPase